MGVLPESSFLFLALVTAGFIATAAGSLQSVDTCSDEDLELITAQKESQKFILDSIIQSFDFPNIETTDVDMSFHDVYEQLARKVNCTISKSGYLKFVEAVNEIAASYTESCGSLLSSLNKMVEEFSKAYDHRKTVEVHNLYGQVVCKDDQLKKNALLDQDNQRTKRDDNICNIDHSECVCPPGGMSSILCPCEFFACLDANNQLEPIFIGFTYLECLVFVVDTTGSMKDEIDYTVQVIKDFLASEEELLCYMFVPFNDISSDPDRSVGNVTLALNDYVHDLKHFLATVENSFKPDTGGDCPEYSYHGIKKALDSLVEDIYISEFGSQIVVITDAPSKGDITASNVTSYAQANDVCVHFFLAENTYNCFADSPGSVEEYRSIADATGGTVVDTKFDFSSFVQVYRNTPCEHLESSKKRRKRAVLENGNCHSFQISSLSSLLKLNVKTNARVVTVRRPDETTTNLINTAHFSERSPQAGVWNVCVGEGGQLEILPEIQVSMDVTPFYFKQDDAANKSMLTCTAPPGCTATKVALYSSQSDSIFSSSVQLLNSVGETATEATLGRCNCSWTGSISTPAVGNYTYQVTGQDENNYSFTYFTRRKVSFVSGEKYYQLISTQVDDVHTAKFGDPIELSFLLTSNNSYGSTEFQFTVEELVGFDISVMPLRSSLAYKESVNVRVTLRVASYRIRPGLMYTAAISATNGCATLSVSKKFTLTTPPTTAPPPELCSPRCQNGGRCVVIRRRNREIARCQCTSGFIGRSCETERRW